MVKYLLLVALTLIAATISRAQSIVKDSLDGSPIMQASVFDERGCVLGVTDMEGRLPVLNNKYIGCKDTNKYRNNKSLDNFFAIFRDLANVTSGYFDTVELLSSCHDVS